MPTIVRSEEHTSELQSPKDLVCRLLLEKKKKQACRIQWWEVIRYNRVFWPLACLLTKSTQPLKLWPTWGNPACAPLFVCSFFLNDSATPEIYPLSPHDAFRI